MLLKHTAGIRCCSRQSTAFDGRFPRAEAQCTAYHTAVQWKGRLAARALRSQQTSTPWSENQRFTTDEEGFNALRALTPLCTARIATPASGVRGLVASTRVSEGQTVLFVPSVNSISVPTGSSASVAAWSDDFLGPWQQKHGPLPDAFVDFIADTHWESTTRLAAWLLYLKKFCTNGSTSSSTLWRSWLALLPGTAEATNACGLWTPAELQQLQLEPFKGLMASVNSLTAAVCSDAFDHMQTGALGQLQLAGTVDDVMWGAFVARTRATSTAGAVTLRPLHDMINHAEQPNASCYITHDGYAIEALSDIPAGSEITISYTGDEPLGPDLDLLGVSSLELLMTWGFTQGPGVQDMILPMQYQALPALDWDTLVAAAAATVVKRQQSMTQVTSRRQADGVVGNTDQLMKMMQAVIGNLPVTHNSIGSSRVSSFYKRAADTVSRYGMLGCSWADVGGTPLPLVSNRSGSAAAVNARMPSPGSTTTSSTRSISSLDAAVQKMAGWLVYERPYLTQLHLREVQSQFEREVCESLPLLQRSVLLADSSGSDGAVLLAQLPLAFMRWASSTLHTGYGGTISSSSSSVMSSGNSMMRLAEQTLVARYLLCEVQLMLLQCGSTIEQDEAVLDFLQTFSTAQAAAPLSPKLNSVLILANKQQQQQTHIDLQPVSVSLSNQLSSSKMLSSYDDPEVGTSQQSVAHCQALLDSIKGFQQCQLDAMRQLMLLNADAALEASLPAAAVAAVVAAAAHGQQCEQQKQRWQINSSGTAVVASSAVLPALQQPVMDRNSTRSTGRTAGWISASSNVPPSLTAPVKVITALTTPGSTNTFGVYKPPVVQRISDLLTDQEQQLDTWRRQQGAGRHTDPAADCEAAVAEAANLLMSGQACKARLMTAVAARMQHKRLLHTCDMLLRQVLEQLDATQAKNKGV